MRPPLDDLPPTAAAALLASVLATACLSEPVAPLPQPLRVNDGWELPPAETPRAWLGLKTRENTSGGFAAFEASESGATAGLRVVRVVENSPAARAGLRSEDRVLALDGAPLADPGTLEALVREKEPGHVARLAVERGDQRFELRVPLAAERAGAEGAARAEVQLTSRVDPARSRAGWLTAEGGVRLVHSHPHAPFPRAGVPAGSLVHAVDGVPQRTDLGLVTWLQAREPGAVVEVDATLPDGERRRVRVRLQAERERVTRLSIPVLFGYASDADGSFESWTLIDLWVLSLFRYERRGQERHWRLLRFIHFATGVGELGG